MTDRLNILINGWGNNTSICGNMIIEKDEQCDDGNTINGDGCNETCQLEIAVRADVNQDSTINTFDANLAFQKALAALQLL